VARARCGAASGIGLTLALALLPAVAAADVDLPFGVGERIAMRITYAHLLAGRAVVSVVSGAHDGRPTLEFVAEARSEGLVSWLFRVDDRSVATWDPATSCSLGIDKRLLEGRHSRTQSVRIDSQAGLAEVEDPSISPKRFDVPRCVLDVLSALFVTRMRGVPEKGDITLPVFDNGHAYSLAVRYVGRERLDLPPPLGNRVPTVIVEPLLREGTGLFVSKGRLTIWLTDDARRIPVRMRSKVALGSVSADLESYTPASAP